MNRHLRVFTQSRPTSVESVQKCFQSRPLLRAGPKLNRRVVGILAKAQELHDVEIHGFVFLNNHWHLNATFRDPKQMARFHCYVGTNVSKEAGRLREWNGSMFPERYHHVEISQEPEMEYARLKYLMSQGCKEGLVSSPLDWPGATSTWALVSGEPLLGEWVDRTALRRARDRGEEAEEQDFTEELELKLSPIRSLAHLSTGAYRREMRRLVREIEDETAARHRVDGTKPIGAQRVLQQDPHERPGSVEKSPRPWFHALDPEIRQAMRTALIYIHVQYRKAADELKAGRQGARFRAHTFPPGLPFVELGLEGEKPALSGDIEFLEPG